MARVITLINVPASDNECAMRRLTLLLLLTLAACKTVTVTGKTFFVKTPADAPAVTLSSGATPLRFTMKDGVALDGYWVRNPTARGTLLCLPGMGDSAGNMQQVVGAWSAALGLNVLVVDYRGAGRSEGTGSIAAFVADADEVVSQWRAMPKHGPERLVLFGVSMGAMAGARLAAAHPSLFSAVILDSPAPNTLEWASNFLPWYAAPFITLKISGDLASLDTEAAVSSFTVPLMVVVGSNDEVTPPAFAQRVFKASVSPVKALHVVAGAEHAESSDKPEFLPLITKFLERAP